jgi:hypothetical protein
MVSSFTPLFGGLRLQRSFAGKCSNRAQPNFARANPNAHSDGGYRARQKVGLPADPKKM